MMRKLGLLVMAAAGLGFGGGSNRFVVHEWGTFTTVASADGKPHDWRPLAGLSDLPSFVLRSNGGGKGYDFGGSQIVARVRMETPVLYFYADREMDVNVRVDFPKGKITEWYPAARVQGTAIDWGRIRIRPGAAEKFPVEKGESHYYPARETDAAPVRVGMQDEKFLFYRGIGWFDVPLRATVEGSRVWVSNTGKDPIAQVIVFENRGGRAGFVAGGPLKDSTTLDRPTLDSDVDGVAGALEKTLVAQGLHLREARSMIKTWRDTWFEEGLRVFYIVPRPLTDELLPLKLSAVPDELVRVLVGRAEILTPEMERTIEGLVAEVRAGSAEAGVTLRKFRTYADPIVRRVLAGEKDAKVWQRVYAAFYPRAK